MVRFGETCKELFGLPCGKRGSQLLWVAILAFLLGTCSSTLAQSGTRSPTRGVPSPRGAPSRSPVRRASANTAIQPVVQPTGELSLANLRVPKDEIRSGGPPKDGIPAITNPKVISVRDANFLNRDSRVIGLTFNGESRAWPLSILTQHEIVNDTLGGIPIAVTYCPLCDSAVVFDRRKPDGRGVYEFGVSGLLYNSNVLMYDRGSRRQSLWSQLGGYSVSGPASGTRLRSLPSELTTAGDWFSRFPKATVMSNQTGYRRDYVRSPYDSYFRTDRLMFPVGPTNRALPNKTRILGLVAGDDAAAIAWSSIAELPKELDVSVGGKKVRLAVDRSNNSIRVVRADEGVESIYSFWFAWHAFHPNTTLLKTR